jgi:hypothetical protein
MDDIRDRFSTKRGNYGTGTPAGRPHAPQNKPSMPTIRPASQPPSQQYPSQQAPPSQPQNNGPFSRPSAPRRHSPQKPAGPAQSGAFISPRKATAKRRNKDFGTIVKIVVIVLLAMLLLAVSFYFYNSRQDKTSSTANSIEGGGESSLSVAEPVSEADPVPTGTIKMLITGDFLAYDSINETAKSGDKYNYLPMMQPLQDIFSSFDLKLCSQSTMGGGAADGLGISGYPLFNAPKEWSTGMEGLGCNVFALASRNSADKGQTAVASVRSYFDGRTNVLAVSGVNRSAKEKEEIAYFTLKGLKMAFISYTVDTQKAPTDPYLLNKYSEAVAKKQVEEAKKNATFVIVAINWGKEDDGAVQPQQKSIAQVLATAGADLIVGSGPHITQAAEIIDVGDNRQSLVWYSLGTAINSKLATDNLIGGVGVVDIDLATGNMTNPGFMPTYMHYEWTAAQKASSNFSARKNLKWMPLDLATDELAKSLLGTTIEAQTKRLKSIITKTVPIEMLTSKTIKNR